MGKDAPSQRKLCWFWCGQGKESSREAEPYYGSKESLPQEHSFPDEGKDPSEASVIRTNATAKASSHSAVAQEPARKEDVPQSPDYFLRHNGNGYGELCMPLPLSFSLHCCIAVRGVLMKYD